jgi:hypothetical protein
MILKHFNNIKFRNNSSDDLRGIEVIAEDNTHYSDTCPVHDDFSDDEYDSQVKYSQRVYIEIEKNNTIKNKQQSKTKSDFQKIAYENIKKTSGDLKKEIFKEYKEYNDYNANNLELSKTSNFDINSTNSNNQTKAK